MHMGLVSLESALKSASFDTKITSIADWEHVEPENTIHCNGIPYSGKYWREENLAICFINGIWRVLIWLS